jgi:hypothetical protein
MEIRISNLKTEFNNISLVRSKIISVFDSLKNKSDKLKMIYSEFIKNTNTQLFVFGLDSFHFQSKLIDLEYDDMKRIFLFVNNRMYCEYFKLYKIICSYVIGNVTDKKIIEIIKGNNFPVYKDLEPFKDYKFETTLEIHENILVLLNSIASIINNRENELSIHRSKQLIGLNIDNFVNSFNYEITLMREKVNLFLSYIEFFHKLHAKYLKRFSNKIQLMSNHINSDIQFDENIENNNNHKINDSTSILDEEEQINETINDTIIDNKNNVNLDIIFDSKHAKHSILDDYEYQSGLNTPSSESYVSTESVSKSSKSNKKIKMPKFIKNGIKKVTNIINGCNNKLTNDTAYDNYDNYDNNKLLVEPLSLNNPNLTIVLSDFDDNVNEDGLENISENNNNNNNEKETQTEETQETVEPEVVEETVETVETVEPEVFEETVEPEVFEETQEPEVVEETLEPEVVEETLEPEVVEETQETAESEVVEETQETAESEVVEETQETVETEVVEETEEPEIVVEPLETVETVEPEVVEETVESEIVEETVEPEVVVETVETVEPEVVEETVEPEVVEETVETVESEESELESP